MNLGMVNLMSTVSKISYTERMPHSVATGGERHRKRPLLSAIASMQDSEIVEAGLRNANEKVKDSKAARVLRKEPLMFIAATSMVYGALAKGKLSNKLLETAKAAATAGVVFALAKPVDNVVGAVLDKKENENKNPAVRTIIDTAALVGASALAIAGMRKGGKFLADKFRPTADSIKSIASGIGKTINGSKAGTLADKAIDSFRKFEKSHTNLANGIKIGALVAPLAGALGLHSVLANKVNRDRNSIAASNINKLVLCRELAKTSVENNSTDEIKK